jgi:hypothetical protein
MADCCLLCAGALLWHSIPSDDHRCKRELHVCILHLANTKLCAVELHHVVADAGSKNVAIVQGAESGVARRYRLPDADLSGNIWWEGQCLILLTLRVEISAVHAMRMQRAALAVQKGC